MEARTVDKVMTVGFIGLGHMGAGMAANFLRVPMPLASLLHDRFLALLAQGGEALDWSAVRQLVAKDAGYSSASVALK
jgi:3-hydroxyisobutyrate dehydrogenase-like beta-hydroxyacid dehydrogenase